MEQAPAQIWGKLIPLAKGLSTYPLKEDKVIIGRDRGHIIISDKRLSRQHCLIEKSQDGKVYLVDLSTNGTYFNHNLQKLGKNNRVEMKDGDEVWLLPISKVSQDDTIGFRLGFIKFEPLKKDEHKQQAQKFISSVKQQITCPFCSEIMVYPVITQPCNHRFCGPCLTHLVNKKKGQCIICRKQLSSAARDATFSAIIDDYFRHNPDEKRRDQDEQANIFGFNPTYIKPIILGFDEPQTKPQVGSSGIEQAQSMKAQEANPERFYVQFQEDNKRGRGRGRGRANNPNKPRRPKKASKFINSDISASTDSDVQMTAVTQNKTKICKECSEPRNGFKCQLTQKHIKCHNCSKPFAIRQDQKFCQCCSICRSYFCNLYMPPCQKNGPKLALLGNRGPTCKIEPIFFRNNKVEMNAFTNLLVSQKKTLASMFKQMLELAQVDKFRYRLDRQILPNTPKVNRQVSIHKKSPICDNCWRDLWFQMIFTYMTEYKTDLPEPIKNRPACYWGVNCHTMSHNIEHAKKYNHMKEQTKFSN